MAAAPENENQAQEPETTAASEALRYSSGDDREDDRDEIDDRFDDDDRDDD